MRGAKVLVDQIRDREQIRLKEVEYREKEKLQLLANIAATDAEEKRRKDKHDGMVVKMLAEVDVSNKHSLQLKEQKA